MIPFLHFFFNRFISSKSKSKFIELSYELSTKIEHEKMFAYIIARNIGKTLMK